MYALIALVLDVAAMVSAVVLITMTMGWLLVSWFDTSTHDLAQRGHK